MLQKEVTMKKLLLFAAIFATAIQLQAGAAVSVDMTTNPKYLEQNGFSTQTTDMVNVSKARALGKNIIPKMSLLSKNKINL